VFRKVLVANRGEIAVRIMRTLRQLDIAAVAVYSEADADAPHVYAASEAVCIGPAPARQSYLSIPAILAAARTTGAEAIHPGYGFLAENPEFARACEAAGLVFIGPTPQSMADMGDKSTARAFAQKAGVPTVPGVEAEADPSRIEAQARTLPLPLLLKAAAGGGGKGMRRVHEWGQLHEAIAAAQREGLAAFGDARLIVERYVHPVRHVEVQVLGDGAGCVVALGERECSLQRRHQKIIEETPSPAVDEPLRQALWDAARRAAASVHYRGAGTVEFLLGPDGTFYFLEMNTRLQVEHPITEIATGFDLVELQLQVAAGLGLPVAQSDVRPRGSAVEVRLYAENPAADFLPTSGRALEVIWPHHPGVRVDAGLVKGQEVGVHYDPLLAKIVAWADTREGARRRMLAALRDTVLVGLVTNQAFLIDLLESEPYRTGQTFTHTVEPWAAEWKQDPAHSDVPPAALLSAVLAGQLQARRGDSNGSSAPGTDGDPFNPWQRRDSWRV
jgi:acetyl/propionyl-CoA carboxylase alpha subunit